MALRQRKAKRRTLGVSRRGYAQGRGVTESAIRRYIASGLLQPAVLADGTLDAAKADELLAGGRTRGKFVAPTLEEARRRKLAAQCRLISDEVEQLRRERATPEIVALIVRGECESISAALTPIVRTADGLAAAEASPAYAALDASVYDTLNAICDAADDRERAVVDEGEASGPAFDTMNATDLAATKFDLEAERLEILRATSRGELRLIPDEIAKFTDRLMTFRGRVLGLPARSAPLYSTTKNPGDARTIALDLIDEALAELAGDGTIVPASQLSEILRHACKF